MTPSTRLATALLGLALSCSAVAQLKAPRAPVDSPAPATAPVPAGAEPSAADEQMVIAGRTAAAGWLSLLDRKDWGTAWEGSATMFRGSVPLANWMDSIPRTRGDLGALVERQLASTRYSPALEGRPPGDYVSAVFASRFEQREVEEIVTTVREPDGRWRVTGYSVR